MSPAEHDRTGDEMTALADLLEAIEAAPEPYQAAIDASHMVAEEQLRVMLAAALVLLRRLLGWRSAAAGRLIADTIRIRESWDAPDAGSEP